MKRNETPLAPPRSEARPSGPPTARRKPEPVYPLAAQLAKLKRPKE
jgi:hypothetical protein